MWSVRRHTCGQGEAFKSQFFPPNFTWVLGDWTQVIGLVWHEPLLCESSCWPFSFESCASPDPPNSIATRRLIPYCWHCQFGNEEPEKKDKANGIRSKTQPGCSRLPTLTLIPTKTLGKKVFKTQRLPALPCGAFYDPYLRLRNAHSKPHQHTFAKSVNSALLRSTVLTWVVLTASNSPLPLLHKLIACFQAGWKNLLNP